MKLGKTYKKLFRMFWKRSIHNLLKKACALTATLSMCASINLKNLMMAYCLSPLLIQHYLHKDSKMQRRVFLRFGKNNLHKGEYNKKQESIPLFLQTDRASQQISRMCTKDCQKHLLSQDKVKLPSEIYFQMINHKKGYLRLPLNSKRFDI